jgi:GAF domain-containing protein
MISDEAEPSHDVDRHLRALETERGVYSDNCRALLERNRELVSVAIAALRLHEASSRRHVYLAIELLFANLFGTQDLAIYEADSRALHLVAALGAGARLGHLSLGAGGIGKVASARVPYLASASRHAFREELDGDIAAIVPLCVGSATVGVVVALRSFAPPRDPPDRDLLELIARQAALALWNQALDEPTSTRPTRRVT